MSTSPKSKNRRYEAHVRALKDSILWEIGLIAGQRNITDDALGEIIGERIDNLAKTAFAGRHASYGLYASCARWRAWACRSA